MSIEIKSASEIDRMRAASLIVYEVLQELAALVTPGISLLELDREAEMRTRKRGAVPAFKGYRGYPCSLCASPNEVVVHGIPSKRKLKEGDILSLDYGVVLNGYYGDSALTVPVGRVSESAMRLIHATREALERGIAQMLPGNRLGDIGAAVEDYVVPLGYSVVHDYVGHGIGKRLHEEPQVPNYGPAGHGVKLRPGMVLAVEPMVNAGTREVELLDDQWTVVTADGALSAHFEHTIAVTAEGPRVLSRP